MAISPMPANYLEVTWLPSDQVIGSCVLELYLQMNPEFQQSTFRDV